ncbi:MAG: monovalent cation/H(+) antiporter subunit G [Anaerolineales bacterium]|nr:monovalent cation/H(+) antiporter subunit G [Anaerolineales bacterium]
MLRELLVIFLMLAGAFFMFLAGVGMQRMPDLFLRMSSTSKAGTLGAGLILLAAAIHFSDFGIATRALAIIVFLMLTAPVAAHMIGRAAYFDGVPLWKGTVRDDLRGHYRASTHALETSAVPENDTPLPPGDSPHGDSEFDR